MVEDNRSVSYLVEEWRKLRSKSQSELDTADFGAFDTIAELYGEKITKIECMIADTDPENVEDIAAMLDVVIDSMESGAIDSDSPPLKMVRRLRSKIHLLLTTPPDRLQQ